MRGLSDERAVCEEIAEVIEDECSTIAGEICARRVLVVDFSTEKNRVVAVSPGGVVLHLRYFHDASLRDLRVLRIAEAKVAASTENYV